MTIKENILFMKKFAVVFRKLFSFINSSLPNRINEIRNQFNPNRYNNDIALSIKATLP